MTKNFSRPEALKLQQIFTKNVRPLLKEKDISFAHIARRLNMSTATISRYFSLGRKMDADVYFIIAEMVGKNVTDLIRENEESE